MDKTKIIVAMLILAIIFSFLSIIISLNVSNMTFPEKNINLKGSIDSSAGNVVFVVERNKIGGAE